MSISSGFFADRAFAESSTERVFAGADRLCRVEPPVAANFARRALARAALGDDAGARADLDRALELEPDDSFALRVTIRLGDPSQRRLAAQRWLAGPASDPEGFREAAAVLLDLGAGIAIQSRRQGGALVGQAAWRGGDGLTAAAGGWRLPIAAARSGGDDSLAIAEFAFAAEDDVAFELAGRIVARDPAPPAPAPSFDDSPERAALHVIVPVYRDLAATQACIASLLPEAERKGARIVLVDDASPEADLRRFLDDVAARPGVAKLSNPRSLGFALSVNRALAVCAGGDVLLLNADAQLPPGALTRLAEVAHRRADIGTVTPLSNNGELTSFPRPFRENPLPDAAAFAAIDGAATALHGHGFIDLPSGVGFCLFIKRACLDAVGRLPTVYRRGYYEDVEFCLRARERGFRNVCALGVYVAHAGSRSFLADKRALVMRNLATLETRFPGHARESAAFVDADPLASARAALAAALPRDLLPTAANPEGAIEFRAAPAFTPAAPLRLGIAAPALDARRDRRLLALGRRLRAAGSPVRIVALGATLNDAEAMASGGVFVTGPMLAADYPSAAALYRLGALAEISPRDDASPLAALARRLSLPMAAFSRFGESGRDLALPPEGDDGAVVGALANWLTALVESSASP